MQTYENYVYAYYPIECIRVSKEEYINSSLPSLEGGFFKVLYASDGTNPQYDNNEMFNFKLQYPNDIYGIYYSKISSSDNLTSDYAYSYIESHTKNEVTPTAKYDNGEAKNYVRFDIMKSSNITDEIIARKNNLLNEKTNIENRKNYYEVLEDNIDVFDLFYIDDWINNLTISESLFSIKTNLVKTVEKLLDQANILKDLCDEYKETEEGIIDIEVEEIYNETLNKINILNNLYNLSIKIGFESNIINQIKNILPSSLIINKILYNDIPSRNCYLL